MGILQTPASLTDRSSDETRDFFQARIASYLLIYTGVGVSFLLMRISFAVVGSRVGREIAEPSFISHLVGALCSLGGWAVVRRGRASVDNLERIEAVALVTAMSAYAAMGLFMPISSSSQETTTLALSFGLFARAIYVPSTARRSLVIGLSVAIVHLGTAIAAPFRPPLDEQEAKMTALFLEMMSLAMEEQADATRIATFQLVSSSLWWAAALVLTTGASRVIYNLRAEVRDNKRLGQYQLGEKLGEGGMGMVYRASHALLQRPTAVKLLPPGRIGAQTLARFEREVRLTARLTHPNTVTVFDYGHTPDGVFYYAMELLGGATLGEIVQRHGRMPPARVVHVLRQVCSSLVEAHGIGLIHRDIKPANIVLCERGGVQDTVKVLDFGLVKDLESGEGAAITRLDSVTGTPQYMPPEALTHPDKVDARSDLYSLGATAFYLLTGEELFRGGTLVEICSHHLHTQPRDPRTVVADVPADLAETILACLAKKPEDRPASARALLDRLAGCGVAGGWKEEDAVHWWRDHPSGEAQAS